MPVHSTRAEMHFATISDQRSIYVACHTTTRFADVVEGGEGGPKVVSTVVARSCGTLSTAESARTRAPRDNIVEIHGAD